MRSAVSCVPTSNATIKRVDKKRVDKKREDKKREDRANGHRGWAFLRAIGEQQQ